MALLIPVISGLVSCISLDMYGSQRLSPSLLFFVDFLIPFPKAVRLFLSAGQENLGFPLSELCLFDIQMLSKPSSLEHCGRTATRLLSAVWERICIFPKTHTVSRMFPESKQQLQTRIFLSPVPILAHHQVER